MAVHCNDTPSQADDDARVSSCIASIMQAFTNGIDIFKRLRERRRKHRARKESQVPALTTNAELQLSESLHKGPQELALRYSECYRSGVGAQFAKGDGG